MQGYLRGRAGNVTFWALIIALVFIPLAALLVDAPRLYTASIRLQSAVDAAAEAASRCVDVDWYQESGFTRLNLDCASAEAQRQFRLTAGGTPQMRPAFGGITVDETADAVTATGSMTVDVLFRHITVRIHRSATSAFRMEQR